MQLFDKVRVSGTEIDGCVPPPPPPPLVRTMPEYLLHILIFIPNHMKLNQCMLAITSRAYR